MEFASRAAIFIDNARRYSRERATALTLQRSLLPTGLSAPSSVEVRHRYLPGSKMIEVGGDWYESIALPGGRVALVVGDVAGHGVRAAVTMGRLRTAIHTLATARAAAGRDAAAARRAHARARPSASRTSPPACTRSSTRSPAAARSPRPATCRRCWSPRTAAASSWTSRRPRRSASGRDPIQTPDIQDQGRQPARAVHRRAGRGPARGDIDEGLARLRETFGPGSAEPPAGGPVQGHAGRRVRRSPARRHRGADRQAAAGWPRISTSPGSSRPS